MGVREGVNDSDTVSVDEMDTEEEREGDAVAVFEIEIEYDTDAVRDGDAVAVLVREQERVYDGEVVADALSDNDAVEVLEGVALRGALCDAERDATAVLERLGDFEMVGVLLRLVETERDDENDFVSERDDEPL